MGKKTRLIASPTSLRIICTRVSVVACDVQIESRVNNRCSYVSPSLSLPPSLPPSLLLPPYSLLICLCAQSRFAESVAQSRLRDATHVWTMVNPGANYVSSSRQAFTRRSLGATFICSSLRICGELRRLPPCSSSLAKVTVTTKLARLRVPASSWKYFPQEFSFQVKTAGFRLK